MRPRLKALSCAAACALFVLGGCVPEAAAGERAAPDFERDIRPILEANCVSCHGPKQQESLLRLDTRGQALKGGMSGAVIVPGKRESRSSSTCEASPRRACPTKSRRRGTRDRPDVRRSTPAPSDRDEAPGGRSPRSTGRPAPAAAGASERARDPGWVRSPTDAFVLARGWSASS
jgi:hypothetical protein